MGPLTPRQLEVAALVARDLSAKKIATVTGLSLHTVNGYIHEAAARLPGSERPRFKLRLFVLNAPDPAD